MVEAEGRRASIRNSNTNGTFGAVFTVPVYEQNADPLEVQIWRFPEFSEINYRALFAGRSVFKVRSIIIWRAGFTWKLKYIT